VGHEIIGALITQIIAVVVLSFDRVLLVRGKLEGFPTDLFREEEEEEEGGEGRSEE